MSGLQNMSLAQRVDIYKQFDEARHTELANLAQEYEAIKSRVAVLEADLDDERTSRRTWRQRAEIAENSLGRNKFAVVLIDGDGYHFSRSFYMAGAGAQAAHSLYSDIQNYIVENFNGEREMELLTMVYYNKLVPMRALLDAEIIQRPNDFDEFFWAFTSSRSLFQAIDCGPGKERADAKLRDTYRFYLNNPQCKYIFLACCHDNGYVAELDKYKHDNEALSKTILVRHGNTANQFYTLNFPFATFNATFEMDPIQVVRRVETAPAAYVPKVTRIPSPATSQDSADTGSNGNANTWSSVTAGAARLPLRTNTSTSNRQGSADFFEPTKVATSATGDAKTGIPVNKNGQRIDRKIQAPSSSEVERFDKRIAEHRLCNTHHLTTAGCYAYNCKYDHHAVDTVMKHTLKYKARSIPCTAGSKCRNLECFYGHQCPWGIDRCTNPKCAFYRNGLHDITDLEIAKFVPANA